MCHEGHDRGLSQGSHRQVRDLLAKGPRSLEVHETGDGGVAVRGLSQFVVRSVSDIAHVLRVRCRGAAKPVTGPRQK